MTQKKEEPGPTRLQLITHSYAMYSSTQLIDMLVHLRKEIRLMEERCAACETVLSRRKET